MTAPERITMQPCAVYGWLHPDRVKYGTEYIRSDLHDATKAQLEKAVAALTEIIARWDTPAWKDVEPTAAVINRARAVLAEIEKGVV